MRKLITLAAAGIAAAALSLAGIAGASASTHPKSNATLVCAGNCVDLSSVILGPDMIQNAVGGKSGTSLNLRAAGTARQNEDFQPAAITVAWRICASPLNPSGLLAADSVLCLHYPGSPVFEMNFAPDSNQTGLCAGVPVADAAVRVSLQPCGTSARTLWGADQADACGPVHHVNVPGSTTAKTNSSGNTVIALNVGGNPGAVVNDTTIAVTDQTATVGSGPAQQLGTDYVVTPAPNGITMLATAPDYNFGDVVKATYTYDYTSQLCTSLPLPSIAVPWINGGDTNFSQPLVLTVNPSSRKPLNVLRVDRLLTSANEAPDTQLFTVKTGPAGS